MADDYIDPRGKHPDNAAYVARDRKSGAEVSFDSWGRKLDSVGNVVSGDRQRAGDAGAKEIRPKEKKQEKGPPAQPKNGYQLAAGISPGKGLPSLLVSNAPQRSEWDNSILPGTTPAAQPGRLLPGGVNPATGLRVETAYNPYRNRQFPPSQAPQLPTGAQPAGAVQQAANPWRSEWEEPLQSAPTPAPVGMTAVPGFGMLPSNIGQVRGNAGIPNANMAYPPTGGSLPNNAFRDAANFWPGGALPMPQSERFDPYQEPVPDMLHIPGFGNLPRSVYNR